MFIYKANKLKNMISNILQNSLKQNILKLYIGVLVHNMKVNGIYNPFGFNGLYLICLLHPHTYIYLW